MRFAEGMWEIALKHESYVATEMVLKELLEIQRLDFGDRYQAGGMAIKRFLKPVSALAEVPIANFLDPKFVKTTYEKKLK